jgi:hypothetical protein
MKPTNKHSNYRKGYVPAKALMRYLAEKVSVLDEIGKIKDSGEKIPDQIEKAQRDLKVRKNRILNNQIFPSMANLVVFFEYLAKSKDLQKLFEDDIKELFGIIDEGKNDKNEYDFNPYILDRLVGSLLSWDFKKDPNNFRLSLMYGLQQIISTKITDLSSNSMGSEIVSSVVSPDMSRAKAWTELYSQRYVSTQWKVDQHEMPSRPIRF